MKNTKINAEMLLNNGLSAKAPDVSPLNYKLDLIHALYWYGVNVSSKDKKQRVIKEFPNYSQRLRTIPDSYFSTIGSLLLLNERGMISPDDVNKTNQMVQSLVETFHSEDIVNDTPKKIEKSNTKKIKQDHLEFISDGFSNFLTQGKTPDFKKYFLENKISGVEYNIIKDDVYRDYQDALLALNGDAYMTEAIGLSKPKLKKYVELFETLFDVCGQKRTRKTKPKTNKQLTKKIKVADEFDGQKTIPPEKIIGAKEMWVYNFKYRKMSVYKATDETGLSVNGASITNYDDEKSESKTIRKVETWKKMSMLTTPSLRKEFNAVRAVPMKVKQRLGDDTIIFKVL